MMTETDEYLEKIILPSSLYREIEIRVVDMFYQNSIHTVPIDPFEIAKNEGFVLVPFSELRKDLKETVKNDEYDGMSFHYAPANKFIIFYDDSQPFSRQRFTLFHEFGHIYMGHKEESALANMIANYFAAYAIAPLPLIWKYKCNSISDIQNTFNTSIETAGYRFDSYSKWLMYKRITPNDERLLKLFYSEEVII